tara:strand:+ start:3955 stop:4584 length:630 start_codon:yes stop_codon:yes gene_type:complete
MTNSKILFRIYNYLFYPERRGIFVHIPKTAGNSVTGVLYGSKFLCIGHDLRDRNYRFPKDIKWFKDLYSCCFVRNPWDRLVSSYFYLKNGGNSEHDLYDFNYYFAKFETFDDLIKNWEDSFYNQIHMKPQSDWIYNEKNECMFDFVGRYENLQKDTNRIMIQNDMLPKYLQKTNNSQRGNYVDYYTKTTSKIVEEIYKEDIENFNYSFI